MPQDSGPRLMALLSEADRKMLLKLHIYMYIHSLRSIFRPASLSSAQPWSRVLRHLHPSDPISKRSSNLRVSGNFDRAVRRLGVTRESSSFATYWPESI